MLGIVPKWPGGSDLTLPGAPSWGWSRPFTKLDADALELPETGLTDD